MARTKTQKILSYFLYGLVMVSVLGAVGYGLIVRPLQIRNQKQNFDKAEANLDSLAIQIEQTIGKPDETKKEKSCDRANLKSEKGPLGCDVSFYLIYEGKNSEQASDLMRRVSILSNAELRIGSGAAKGLGFIDFTQQRGEQTFFQDFDSDTSLSCAFSYTYPGTDHEKFAPEQKENLQLGIGCGGPAMKEFFPLKD